MSSVHFWSLKLMPDGIILRSYMISLLLLCCSKCFLIIVVVQLLSRVQLFVTPWTSAHQASLPFTVFWSLLRLMSIFDYGRGKFQEICWKGMFLISMFLFIFATTIFVFKSSNTCGSRKEKC